LPQKTTGGAKAFFFTVYLIENPNWAGARSIVLLAICPECHAVPLVPNQDDLRINIAAQWARRIMTGNLSGTRRKDGFMTEHNMRSMRAAASPYLDNGAGMARKVEGRGTVRVFGGPSFRSPPDAAELPAVLTNQGGTAMVWTPWPRATTPGAIWNR
jgi:hypothetical protein